MPHVRRPSRRAQLGQLSCGGHRCCTRCRLATGETSETLVIMLVLVLVLVRQLVTTWH